MREISQRQFAVVVLLILFTMIAASNYEMIKIKITGLHMLFSGIGVSIEEIISGKILLAFDPLLEIGEVQHIYTEFINIGTENYTAQIKEYIYFLNGTKMELQISYYDTEVPLAIGGRRGFRTVFKPPEPGSYYIKIKVSYSYKVAQQWGVFYVSEPGVVTTTYPAPPAPGPAVTTTTLGPANVRMEVPDNVTIIEGETRGFGVEITNIGDRVLNNLRFFISSPDVLNVSINPKIVRTLRLNRTTSFLISVSVADNTSKGIYPVELEFTTNEMKKSKVVNVIVVPSNVSLVQYLQELILNYEYLIDRIESEIYVTVLDGYDVSLANESLNKAKTSLQLAKDYFETQDFDNTKKALRNTLQYLEDAVFYLASSMLYGYRPPAYYPLLLIIVEGIIAIGIFLIFFWNRRKKEKPKSLKKRGKSLENI